MKTGLNSNNGGKTVYVENLVLATQRHLKVNSWIKWFISFSLKGIMVILQAFQGILVENIIEWSLTNYASYFLWLIYWRDSKKDGIACGSSNAYQTTS